MVILTDPGKVTGEHGIPGLQQPQVQQHVQPQGQHDQQGVEAQVGASSHQAPETSTIQHLNNSDVHKSTAGHISTGSGSSGILIPGAQNRAGYIHLTEDPT
ncbi:hypothetical protein BGZ94_001835, partial [Podila epigama]